MLTRSLWVEHRLSLPQSHHNLVCRQNRVCEKRKVDERRRIAVAPFGVSRAGGRVLRDGDLETLLEQIAQVRFDTHVCQHPAEDDLADAALAQLQDEVVCLRSPYPVGTNHDGLSVLDVGLEALQPVGTRSGEAVEAQHSATSEHLGLCLFGLKGSVEFLSLIRGVEIVGRDEDLESVLLRGLEDALHVLDGLVLFDAVADRSPRDALLTQDIILRVDEYQCGVILVNIYGLPPSFLRGPCHHDRRSLDER